MGSWEKSLDILMSGNERFVNDECNVCRNFDEQRRLLVEEGQHPIAVIVSPSDSYMPPEHIFDTGIGALYVLRMPELEIDRTALDAIEFAAEKLQVPLCMILAHETRQGDPEEEEGFWERFRKDDDEEEYKTIKACVQRVRNSTALQDTLDAGEFFVVGAKYDLSSGRVTVFDF